jgi:hypothetical protein
MTKTKAIVQTRRRVGSLHKFADNYKYYYWCFTRSAYIESIPRDYRLAQISRSQTMIDIACELLGIEDYPQYYGGDWTNYIPKKK